MLCPAVDSTQAMADYDDRVGLIEDGQLARRLERPATCGKKNGLFMFVLWPSMW